MKNLLLPFFFLFLFSGSFAQDSTSADTTAVKPDTVKAGIYITSIHDIDFKEKEYAISLWLWLKYKNKDFDFLNNLEIPQAKSVEKSFSVIDSSGDQIYMQMKLQCVMKDSWRVTNFPFDRQTLRLSIENSQFDSRSLIFVADSIFFLWRPLFFFLIWSWRYGGYFIQFLPRTNLFGLTQRKFLRSRCLFI